MPARSTIRFILAVLILALMAILAGLALVACLPMGAPARAAQTPGVRGLNSPPEMQNTIKERNLVAPGKLTGHPPARGLGRMPPPAKARVPAKTGPDGKETPQSFRERHRLRRGAAPSQASRDVLLNQRIQGRAPSSLQRRPIPTKKAPEAPAAQPPTAPTPPTPPAMPDGPEASPATQP
ncbi:MAG: hypothetical protein V1806_04610 [Pseudomonadota bacterium]